MSRTIRSGQYRDGQIENITKDKNPRKQFMWRGEGWSSKARGGIGNKRGWGGFGSFRCLPRWLYRKYKEKELI